MPTQTTIHFLNKHNTERNLFRLHSHDCYELVYVLAGNGRITVGEENHTVSEHSFCIVPPYVNHTECMEGYGEILFIGFHHDASHYPLKEGVYQNEDPETFDLLKEIFREYKEQNAGYEAAARALLDLFLISALRRHKSPLPEASPKKSLEHIRQYIEQHSDQKIHFQELALISGYSSDHFRHIFRKEFHVSPQEYLIDTRLENARRLLLKAELSCTEIAYQCGFSNAAQLSSMFRKKWGIPPVEYRKRAQV